MTSIAYVLLGIATSVMPLPADTPAARGEESVQTAQVIIRQRVIIRVPALSPTVAPVPLPRPIVWKEVKGPKCVSMSALAGAAITRRDTVDLFLRGGRRLRALLDNECPALDYYSGFYLTPTKDGQVCGGRDTIHTRSGGKCEIEKFREMVPQR